MPSQRFEHSALARTGPDRAWLALQVPSTWEAVAGVEDVHDPVHDEHGLLQAYRFTATAAGRRYPGRARTIVAEPLERMMVGIETSELDGSVDVTLGHADEGVEVGVTLRVRSKSLMAGMFFSTIARAIGSGLPANVDAFASRLDGNG
jgi:hypothetical protein